MYMHQLDTVETLVQKPQEKRFLLLADNALEGAAHPWSWRSSGFCLQYSDCKEGKEPPETFQIFLDGWAAVVEGGWQVSSTVYCGLQVPSHASVCRCLPYRRAMTASRYFHFRDEC